VALVCLDLYFLSPFLGDSSFFKFTQWSCQVKYGNLNVSDFCSPSKVRSNHIHSSRERHFVTIFLGNDARTCWS
jgi:hypothetical protein